MSQFTLKGTSVSPGFALGPARVHSTSGVSPVRRLLFEDVDNEIARFEVALSRAEDQLRRDIKLAADHISKNDARILKSHLALISDINIRDDARKCVRNDHVDAASAITRALTQFAKPYEALMPTIKGEFLAEARAAWSVVINILSGRDVSSELQPMILVAEELTPQFASFIERGAVAGVLAEGGGRYSHGAILARSFGVPAIVGVRDLLRRVRDGISIAINGDDGSVYIEPTAEEALQIQQKRDAWRLHRKELQAAATLPASTKDGVRVSVMANVDNLRDLEGFDVNIIDGIGLYRTEYLFIDSNEFLSEDDQYYQYRRILEKMKGRPVTFRTVDSGGDKPLPYFQTPKEENPALGWRGVRISLEMPDLFIPQLRAIMRAAAHGETRILIPMVTTVEELRAIRNILASIVTYFKSENIEYREVPLGAMIEVPAAALSMDAICEVSDFVSIGTNDLVQYLLGVDRDNTRVGALYDPFHPGVLRTIAGVVERANANNREVSLCGELASDPQTTPLLLGLGLRNLSMTPVAIAQVKAAVRETDSADARELATAAIQARTATEARKILSCYDEIRKNGDSGPRK
ncbi:MAG: phosphoenolpyruvate--protein phosphotransferase [Planctomycetes bacterium]|nr:phosphoenolpyruvate--protein phosphotransferase [Planctomycetota bacterium]